MTDELAGWLEQHGLGRFAPTFAENGIDVDILPHLTDDDLRELGLVLGDRRRLRLALEHSPLANSRRTSAESPLSEAGEPRPAGESVRSQITVMFCDLVGSTALSTALDPEELREVIRSYQDICAAMVARYEGFIARYMGDGVLVYFGYPQAHENDAERAINTGLEIVETVHRLEQGLSVRVGIATGLVIVGDVIGEGASEEAAITGKTPNLAARLQAIAEPGSVAIASTTRDLAGGLFEYVEKGDYELKGFSEPVKVWSVLKPQRVESRFEARRMMGMTRLIGRDEELEMLSRRWAYTGQGKGQLVMISGEPGIGKSRLVQAFRETVVGESPVQMMQCSPYHTSSALFPFVEASAAVMDLKPTDTDETKLDKLEAWVRLGDQSPGKVTPLLAPLFGIDPALRYPSQALPPQRQKEMIFEALADRTKNLSQRESLALVYEDAHWIDPTSLELVNFLIGKLKEQRVMFVVTFRPEFNAPWIGQANATLMALNRLEKSECAAVAMDVGGVKALPANVIEQIAERGEGVPLFIEELTRSVMERSEGSSDAESRIEIPATLRDSLEARLDHLGPAKEVAQIGAAIGRTFEYSLIGRVSSLEKSKLDDHLGRLVHSGLVFTDGQIPEASFTFKHALVQDTAYNSLLKSNRRTLHRRIADTLESGFSTLAESQPELVAHHYAESQETAKAIDYWRKAGSRAAEQWNHTEAVEYFLLCEKHRKLLPESKELREMGLELGFAAANSMRIVDRHGEAIAILDELEPEARDLNNAAFLARMHHLRGNLFFALGFLDECQAEHEKSREYAQKAGLPDLEAQALSGLGDAAYMSGRMATATTYFKRCTEIAHSHGLDETYAVNLVMETACEYWSTPTLDTFKKSLDAAAVARNGKHARAEIIAGHIVFLISMELGKLDIARKYIDRSLEVCEQIGAERFYSESLAFKSRLCRIEGQYAQARELAERAVEISRRVGMAYVGPCTLVELACLADDPVQREEMLREGEDILSKGTAFHNYAWFYREAMDLALRSSQWEKAERYANDLEKSCTSELSEFFRFQAARVRTLASLGRGDTGPDIKKKLTELVKDARQVGALLDLPHLEEQQRKYQ